MDLIAEKELYADSIEFSYGSHHSLLTGVHVNCRVGEVVALLGRNGAGKSTLMKILFGVLRAKNAYIRLNGNKTRFAFKTKDICYLPQYRYLPAYISVYNAIRLMVSRVEARKEIEKDEVIAKVLYQKTGDLSMGEQRYLELILLLYQPATFYLLDEPFSGVSPYLKERIQELITAHRHCKGFIISDHHYHSVLDISTRILLLQNGGCRSIEHKKDLEYFYVPEGTFDD
ncbi:MAG: ATP-binding cassette domain-containing protein [Sphingobacterium sp.]|jgi:ABC-type multidrug transport system ATPase subunit|nr:ATP-binding cassette domain-containing protein [Sphingobacterium sp.]